MPYIFVSTVPIWCTTYLQTCKKTIFFLWKWLSIIYIHINTCRKKTELIKTKLGENLIKIHHFQVKNVWNVLPTCKTQDRDSGWYLETEYISVFTWWCHHCSYSYKFIQYLSFSIRFTVISLLWRVILSKKIIDSILKLVMI